MFDDSLLSSVLNKMFNKAQYKYIKKGKVFISEMNFLKIWRAVLTEF